MSAWRGTPSAAIRRPILHFPGVIHGVVGGSSDQELDRPGSGRPTLRVVGPDRVEIVAAVARQPVGLQHDLAFRPDLDLPGELLRLVDDDVADDLVAGPAGAPRTGQEFGRRRSGDL